MPQETKGVFKKLPLLPKESGSKAAVIPLACVLSGAGWLRPQALEEEMPSLVQAASQPPVLKVPGQWRGGIVRKGNVQGTRQINEILPI